MKTQKVIDLIEAAGVKFKYRPTRAHHRMQGQTSVTFLCLEYLQGRKTRLDQYVDCEYRGRNFNEIELCNTSEKIDGIRIEEDSDFPMRLQIWYNGSPR